MNFWLLLFCILIIIADKCRAPLGMENNKIADDQITASSEWYSASGKYHGANNARLNRPSQPGSIGAWCAAASDVNPWIQVDLSSPTWITGVRIQERGDSRQWVTECKVEYSSNGQNWMYVQSSGDQEGKVS